MTVFTDGCGTNCPAGIIKDDLDLSLGCSHGYSADSSDEAIKFILEQAKKELQGQRMGETGCQIEHV